jgi:TRAP-type C4-dicarboxylate transport system substrate-binding protein
MAFPDVYAAMESKAIDGHENPFTVINANTIIGTTHENLDAAWH